jgi:diacylglycerol kinase (ATP)
VTGISAMPNNSKPKKFIFFINPLARDGKLGRQWQEVEHHFKEQLPQSEFLMPTSPDQCREQVANRACQDNVCLVAVGGEGTMNTVANGILDVRREHDVCMGLVPYGNVNDYAMTIGMHRNWHHALETLKACQIRKVGVTELVTLNGSFYSLNLADVGFGASTAKQHSVDRQLSWLKGQFKYNMLAIKMLLKWRNVPSHIVIDDESIDADLSILLAGFSPTLGAFRLVPHARPFGDTMAITVGVGMKKLEMLKRIQQSKSGEIKADEHVFYRSGTRVVIEADSPLVCEVDGEIVDTGAYHVEFIAHPWRLNFLVPAVSLVKK